MNNEIINNLIKRQNQTPPFNDGRKICLVLYGGIMLGVRQAGALAALEDAGLTNAFDSIYCMSSGFSNACYFLAGQMKTGAEAYYHELASKKFINLLRFWKIADIDYMLHVMRTSKILDTGKVKNNPTNLYAMLVNADDNESEFLEIHQFPSEKYLDMIRASSLLPLVAHGSVDLGRAKYRDIIKDNNLVVLMQKALSTDATDILVIYNYAWQRDLVRKYIKDIDSNRVFEICLALGFKQNIIKEKLNRFETNPVVLKKEFDDSYLAASRIIKCTP